MLLPRPISALLLELGGVLVSLLNHTELVSSLLVRGDIDDSLSLAGFPSQVHGVCNCLQISQFRVIGFRSHELDDCFHGLWGFSNEHHRVRNSFVSIYFSHFKLFLPTNAHSSNTCFHFHYDLTTCSLPLISFRFHHSHQVRTFANTAKLIQRSIEEQELSTREVLRPAPSPIRSRIARRR